MVRGFGALLVVGIVFALLLALTAGTAALVAAAAARRGRRRSRARCAAPGSCADAARGAAGAAGGAGLGAARRARCCAARCGGRGGCWRSAWRWRSSGWALDSQTEVVSDVERLVPQDLHGACEDLQALQRATGVAGEVDVIVEGDDLTDPKVVAWMRDYQAGLLKNYGYSATNGCGKAELCPALSLTDLFRDERRGGDARAGARRCSTRCRRTSPRRSSPTDRKTANLAFGIRLMPLERQQEIIDDMRARLNPPPGVTRASSAGCRCSWPGANDTLSDPLRRLGTLLAGLLAVALALLAVYRRWERALVPLVPIALATGWSALVLFAMRIPLNPMSATLGALVIAISTEFSRAARRRASARSAPRGWSRPRRCGRPTRRPARRCSPRARPRSPASRCWRSPTSRCCATSAS